MNTWQGGWDERAEARVKALGFESLDDYLIARRNVAYAEMASELGGGVLGVHLARLELERAHACGAEVFCQIAKRSLLRNLRDAQPGDRIDVSGCSIWASQVASVDEQFEARAIAVCRDLMEHAPEGWRPSGENDPILAAAFESAWAKNKTA
jgi:hypothetical protein